MNEFLHDLLRGELLLASEQAFQNGFRLAGRFLLAMLA